MMLSIIIVNFNSGDRLARCLCCLEAQSFRDFEVIVIDNASSDRSADCVKDADLECALIRSPSNLGFAAGNNYAARTARGDWLVFLNPDAYAKDNWLEKLVDASSRYPDADAFGSTQIAANDPGAIDGAGDVLHGFGVAYRGHFGWPIEKLPGDGACFSPCAAAAMYKKSAFDELGGFDERFFCYGEDVDLGLRLRMSGRMAVQVADAQVLHEGSGVTGRHSAFTTYHGHRNRIWLARKNFPSVIFWGALPLRLATDLALFAKASIGGQAGPYLKALRDGHFGGGPIRSGNLPARRRSKIGAAALARLMAWSPMALASRRAVLRRLASLRAGA